MSSSLNLFRSISRAREEVNIIPLLVGNGCDWFGVGEGLEEEDVDGGGEEVFEVLPFLLAIVSSEACIFWNMDRLVSGSF